MQALYIYTRLQVGIGAIDERGIVQMRVTIKKWGNSVAVRLPASVMQATQLKIDEMVEVREDRGRIVIERVTSGKYELSDLLKGITNKNQHRAIDFGPPVGGEI
jgi:antitoxin MazE